MIQGLPRHKNNILPRDNFFVEFQRKVSRGQSRPRVPQKKLPRGQAPRRILQKRLPRGQARPASPKEYHAGSGLAGGRPDRQTLKELHYTALEEFQKKYHAGLRPPWILQKNYHAARPAGGIPKKSSRGQSRRVARWPRDNYFYRIQRIIT